MRLMTRNDRVRYLGGDGEFCNYLTLGKIYTVVSGHEDGLPRRNAFKIIDDDGEAIFNTYPECAHGRWEVVEHG